MQTLEQLIEKYSSRLKVMKENLSNEIDELDDATTNQYLKEISLTAEISRDLKSLLNKTVFEETYIEILGFKETSPYRFDKMKFPFFGKIVKNRFGENDLDLHGNVTFLDEDGEEWSTYHFITNKI